MYVYSFYNQKLWNAAIDNPDFKCNIKTGVDMK